MIFSIIFSYLSTIYTWKGAVQFEKNLKGDFFKSIFSYNYKEFSKKSVGEYISIQANDITQLEQDYLQPLINIIISTNMLIIYGVILFVYVDWRIATLILLASIISVLTPKLTANILANKRSIYLEQVSVYTSRIKDFLEGFKLIQTRTKENINHEHKKILQETLEKRLDYGNFKALTLHINGFTMDSVGLIAFISVGVLLLRGEITIGTGIASFGYINAFIAPIQSILYDINAISSMKKVKEKTLGYINNHSATNLIPKEGLEGNIQLDDVSLKCGNFTLKEIACTFEKGKKYAIIGHSGSGKSTLLNVLINHIDVDQGTILIDQENLNQLDHSNVIYSVSQQDHIFNDTFYNNITMFSSYPFMEFNKISDYLKPSMMGAIKEKENCQLLSGGEKQVLSFMRALSADTPVLIMDEPFSAVDIGTSSMLENTLLELPDKMVILVTHKITKQLENFDEVIFMDNGRIVHKGHYSEVSKTKEFERFKMNY